MKKKTLLRWSRGKDSAWALHLLQQDPTIDLAGLFTAVNQKYNRVSMHATRLEMLQHQAEAVGLPVQMINLPDPCTNEQYEDIMGQFIMASAAKGVEVMAFGDLYLEDVRKYREDRMKGTGVELSFPLWGIPTRQLAEHMLSAGLEAYISSVDLKKLPAHFAGQKWSRELIAEFPQGSDACGENSEIHTVAVGVTMFQKPIPVSVGEVFEQNGFAYADIIPC